MIAAQTGEPHLRQTAILTIAWLFSILFVTFHLADDILFKMSPAGLPNLSPGLNRGAHVAALAIGLLAARLRVIERRAMNPNESRRARLRGQSLAQQIDMETTEQRIQRVCREEVAIAPYDSAWPESFRREKKHLLSCLPNDLIVRIEHFGSTAVPGLAAKPIVDMLVQVTDLQATRERIAPVLESQGYDYLWRPTHGDDGAPFYAWFIKRDPRSGARTHHIHMVEGHFAEHWERLVFRDYLIQHLEVAREYEALKIRLASASPRDRVAYARGKAEFIDRMTERAKRAVAGPDNLLQRSSLRAAAEDER